MLLSLSLSYQLSEYGTMLMFNIWLSQQPINYFVAYSITLINYPRWIQLSKRKEPRYNHFIRSHIATSPSSAFPSVGCRNVAFLSYRWHCCTHCLSRGISITIIAATTTTTTTSNDHNKSDTLHGVKHRFALLLLLLIQLVMAKMSTNWLHSLLFDWLMYCQIYISHLT